MSGRAADFNYKVALASGLKSLQKGRLRQAEEQFRYLVQHFPAADGGYRGLAKVLVEQEDRPAALRVLLDGGAALAKSGERTDAVSLYREATALDPHDLGAHRRLAAALALSGEDDAAASEYVRFIQSALDAHDAERARLESQYALERMPQSAQIATIARAAGAEPGAAPAHANGDTPLEDERAELMRSAFGSGAPAGTWHATPSADATAWQAEAAPMNAWETTEPETPVAAPAPRAAEPMPAMEPIGDDVDAATVEATAARYIAEKDPRAAPAALEAARRYIAAGHVDAASDLLLQLIAAGIGEHEAQRLLVDVTKTLGKRDVAKAKVQLLVEALRLDGRNELAAEVEQLAQAF